MDAGPTPPPNTFSTAAYRPRFCAAFSQLVSLPDPESDDDSSDDDEWESDSDEDISASSAPAEAEASDFEQLFASVQEEQAEVWAGHTHAAMHTHARECAPTCV